MENTNRNSNLVNLNYKMEKEERLNIIFCEQNKIKIPSIPQSMYGVSFRTLKDLDMNYKLKVDQEKKIKKSLADISKKSIFDIKIVADDVKIPKTKNSDKNHFNKSKLSSNNINSINSNYKSDMNVRKYKKINNQNNLKLIEDQKKGKESHKIVNNIIDKDKISNVNDKTLSNEKILGKFFKLQSNSEVKSTKNLSNTNELHNKYLRKIINEGNLFKSVNFNLKIDNDPMLFYLYKDHLEKFKKSEHNTCVDFQNQNKDKKKIQQINNKISTTNLDFGIILNRNQSVSDNKSMNDSKIDNFIPNHTTAKRKLNIKDKSKNTTICLSNIPYHISDKCSAIYVKSIMKSRIKDEKISDINDFVGFNRKNRNGKNDFTLQKTFEDVQLFHKKIKFRNSKLDYFLERKKNKSFQNTEFCFNSVEKKMDTSKNDIIISNNYIISGFYFFFSKYFGFYLASN